MIHYTKHFNAKSKAWVTFVHGAGGSSSIWYKQLREFGAKLSVIKNSGHVVNIYQP